MATYYVRPDGNDSNTGLGSSAAQAWRTVQYALTNMVLTAGTNYLYLAPGIYRESPVVNVTPSSTQTLVIQGDPLCTVFSGVNAGQVRITNYANDSTVPTYATAFTCAKQYVSLRNIYFEIFGNIAFTNSNYCSVIQCVFNCVHRGNATNAGTVRVTPPSNIPSNFTADRCMFTGSQGLQLLQFDSSVQFSHNALITRCLFLCKVGIANLNNPALSSYGGGYTVWNSTFICNETGMSSWSFNTTDKVYVYNSLFIGTGDTTSGITASNANTTIENYNRFAVGTPRNNVGTGVNSISGTTGISYGYDAITGLPDFSICAPAGESPLIGAGLVAGAPTSDINGDAWTTGIDVGAFARTNFNNQSFYIPTEKNESVYTVAQGSTSQTIELYLGVTGLTPTTTGLVAHYVRSKSAPVQIPLVAQTPTGSWVSGGFCQISASNVPGLYRLDVPDAAFAQGAENVTIYVRGAAGSNGAVVDVSMSYPVTAQMVRMGPYKLISNHMGADNPLEVLKGVQAPVDVQLVDNSGGGIDITGATVTAKVYNASSQLIDTYTCTPTYALDGRCSFNLDTTVTDNSGHYTVTVTRQVGGNIVVFGPLRCLVRAN